MRWSPVSIEKFAKGQHYREVAVFNEKIEAVASRVAASVAAYEHDGLGKARGFCLQSEAGDYAYLEQAEMAAEPDLIGIAVDARCSNWQAQVEAIASAVGAKGLRWVHAV